MTVKYLCKGAVFGICILTKLYFLGVIKILYVNKQQMLTCAYWNNTNKVILCCWLGMIGKRDFCIVRGQQLE